MGAGAYLLDARTAAIGATGVFLLIAFVRVLSTKRSTQRGLNNVLTCLGLFLVLRVAYLFIPHESMFEANGDPTVLEVSLRIAGLSLVILAGSRLVPLLLFDYFLAHRRGQNAPRIIRDVVMATLYVVAGMAILSLVFPGINVGSMVATAGVASLVLGLALQDTLGNVFAGLALQAEKPFATGDWITVGNTTGVVIEIDWRATKVMDFNHDVLVIPNSVIGRSQFTNHSRPARRTGCEIIVDVGYETPPNRVQQALVDVVMHTPGVLKEPPPFVRLIDFGPSAAKYELQFWVANYEAGYHTSAKVRSSVWYALRREQIDIQVPVRVIRTLSGDQDDARDEAAATAETLSQVGFLRTLGADALRKLAETTHRAKYGAGEIVVTEGEQGEECFFVVSGVLKVVYENGGTEQVVARLEAGDHFGEMSALSDDPRSSTVVADTDVDLVVLPGEGLRLLLTKHPETAERLSEVLESRRAELGARDIQTDDGGAGGEGSKGPILQRLRRLLGVE